MPNPLFHAPNTTSGPISWGGALESLESLITAQPGLINAHDNQGTPLLCTIARTGDEACLKFLLQKKANPHATDTFGQNALHHAIHGNNAATIRYLVTDYGLSLDATDLNGEHALYKAAKENKAISALTLMELGGDPAAPTSFGLSALQIAGSRGNFDLREEMLSAQALKEAQKQQAALVEDLSVFFTGVALPKEKSAPLTLRAHKKNRAQPKGRAIP